MAKKGKKKSSLNTDLDDTSGRNSNDYSDDSASYKSDNDDLSDAEPAAGDLASDGDDITYTMGDIQVQAGDDDDDEEFKKASKNLIKDSDSDGEDDEEWIEEDINTEDSDPFLDMDETYDMDNPAGFED